MKRILIFLLFAATILCSGSAQNMSYSLNGTLEDKNIHTLYLISSNQVIDTVTVSRNGHFSFTGKVQAPRLAYITNTSSFPDATLNCTVILEQGILTMLPLDNYDGYKVTGSKSNDLMAEKALKSIELIHYYEGKPSGMIEYEKKWSSYLKKNVRNNKDNMFGLVCLSELTYYQNANDTRKLLDSFKPEIQETDLWKDLDESNYDNLGIIIGGKYKDFRMTDIHGNNISAKDIIATPELRYVLIDFWASWCNPCMNELPYLKDSHTRFSARGFQILGVSLDSSHDKWVKTVNENKMNWIHVSDLKGWQSTAVTLYGIKAIPANFLIDCKTGKIVAKDLRGEELAEKVAMFLARGR